jgi:hypothetical protein
LSVRSSITSFASARGTAMNRIFAPLPFHALTARDTAQAWSDAAL